MRKTIRLTEKDLKNIVSKSVKRIIKEGVINGSLFQRFDNICNELGEQKVLDELLNYLDNDTIENFISSIERAYEITNPITDDGDDIDDYDFM